MDIVFVAETLYDLEVSIDGKRYIYSLPYKHITKAKQLYKYSPGRALVYIKKKAFRVLKVE